MQHLARSPHIALAAAFLAVASVAFAQMPSEEALVAMPVEWGARYNANDLEGVSMLYAEDAVVMPPNAELVQGRDNVTPILAAYQEAGAVRIDVHALESYGIEGGTAWGVGPYRLFDGDGEVVGVGKFLIMYRAVDGTWKITRHIWNSDLPPAAPEG
ncbi:MAG: DUF4440 domain-containing protein [Trueperaceae bacterium]|nr:DUF4440 domain-containing protein [Trueperaceae bacterium]